MKTARFLAVCGSVNIAFAYFRYWRAEPLSLDFFRGQHDETLGAILLVCAFIILAIEKKGTGE